MPRAVNLSEPLLSTCMGHHPPGTTIITLSVHLHRYRGIHLVTPVAKGTVTALFASIFGT